nr:uncharacterized protein LOC125970660 [Syngnathus scovelli]
MTKIFNCFLVGDAWQKRPLSVTFNYRPAATAVPAPTWRDGKNANGREPGWCPNPGRARRCSKTGSSQTLLHSSSRLRTQPDILPACEPRPGGLREHWNISALLHNTWAQLSTKKTLQRCGLTSLGNEERGSSSGITSASHDNEDTTDPRFCFPNPKLDLVQHVVMWSLSKVLKSASPSMSCDLSQLCLAQQPASLLLSGDLFFFLSFFPWEGSAQPPAFSPHPPSPPHPSSSSCLSVTRGQCGPARGSSHNAAFAFSLKSLVFAAVLFFPLRGYRGDDVRTV